MQRSRATEGRTGVIGLSAMDLPVVRSSEWAVWGEHGEDTRAVGVSDGGRRRRLKVATVSCVTRTASYGVGVVMPLAGGTRAVPAWEGVQQVAERVLADAWPVF